MTRKNIPTVPPKSPKTRATSLKIAGVFRPQMNIPFVIKNRLTFDAPDGLGRSTGALVTNFETEGHLEVVIGVSFIKKTFHLGRVFHYTHQLGSWSF